MSNIEGKITAAKVIPPRKDFPKPAHISSKSIYAQAAKNPQKFWAEQAKNLVWFKPWKKVLEWKAPYSKWFVGGKLNAAYNCLDRFLGTPTQNKAAIIWEGEPGDSRTLTYKQPHSEGCKFSNGLKGLGVKKGDRVIVYMPMIPELAITVLACARIGAVH